MKLNFKQVKRALFITLASFVFTLVSLLSGSAVYAEELQGYVDPKLKTPEGFRRPNGNGAKSFFSAGGRIFGKGRNDPIDVRPPENFPAQTSGVQRETKDNGDGTTTTVITAADGTFIAVEVSGAPASSGGDKRPSGPPPVKGGDSGIAPPPEPSPVNAENRGGAEGEPFEWVNTGPVPAEPVPDESSASPKAEPNGELPMVVLDPVDVPLLEPSQPSPQKSFSPLDSFNMGTAVDTGPKLSDVDFESLLRPDKVMFDASRGAVIYYIDGKAHTEYEYKREALLRAQQVDAKPYEYAILAKGGLEERIGRLEKELAWAEKKGYVDPFSTAASGIKSIAELKQKLEEEKSRLRENSNTLNKLENSHEIWNNLLHDLRQSMNMGVTTYIPPRGQDRQDVVAPEVPEQSAVPVETEDQFAAADALDNAFSVRRSASKGPDASSIQHPAAMEPTTGDHHFEDS